MSEQFCAAIAVATVILLMILIFIAFQPMLFPEPPQFQFMAPVQQEFVPNFSPQP